MVSPRIYKNHEYDDLYNYDGQEAYMNMERRDCCQIYVSCRPQICLLSVFHVKTPGPSCEPLRHKIWPLHQRSDGADYGGTSRTRPGLGHFGLMVLIGQGSCAVGERQIQAIIIC